MTLRLLPLLFTLASITGAAQNTPQTTSPVGLSLDCKAAGAVARVFSPDAKPAGFGFDLAAPPASQGGSCTSAQPFFLSAAVPEGNYRVRLVLGGPKASVTTVRAESRRLMVMQQAVAAGKSQAVEFLVNVRTAALPGTDPRTDKPLEVKLKPREIGALDWDTKLTLEFNGRQPSIRSLSITPAPDVPTLYLAGDSTVVDQDKEPWAAWGQMLPLFFKPTLAVSNQAESGETIKSFEGERRFTKNLHNLKPGDTLMMQFAHNDQKPGAGYVPAQTDYREFLKKYIAMARERGATPILVTPMNRRSFDPAGHITQTLGDYPAVIREVGASEHVAVIDLNAMSKTLYETLGDAGTLKAFVHYPANTFPGQTVELKDDTHFNSYGAYELARLVVQSIADQHLPLAAQLRDPHPHFNPAHPDMAADFTLPASPSVDLATPYGR